MTPEPSGQSAAQLILTLVEASNARANAATCGPWISGKLFTEYAVDTEMEGDPHNIGYEIHREADAAFIAASRTELPHANEAIAELVKGLREIDDKCPAWEEQPTWYVPPPPHWAGDTARALLTRTLAILKGE